MNLLSALALGATGLWALAHTKTSRADGEFIKKLHPYRRMIPYIMETRDGATVYFDRYINAEPLLEYLEELKENGSFEGNMTHAVVAAAFVGLSENPRMNRFVQGYRIYKRKGRFITFSMKRTKGDRKAKIAMVKHHMKDGETFKSLCEAVNAKINVERSDKKTYVDKELDIFGMIPRPLLRIGVKMFRTVDYFNLLPHDFIYNDGMFTSIFIANLGSLKMGAGYHHLYEWGTCPLFLMVGQVEERPAVVDGELCIQKQLHVRFTYEERIDDGLTARGGIESMVRALENPYEYLGCLKEDGSDARAFDKDAIED